MVKIQTNCYHLFLPGDKRFLVRLVGPEDRACLLEGFRQLSSESRRLRFLTDMYRLPEHYLAYLTEMDNINHLAWGAKDLDCQNIGVGIGRYIRLKEEPQAAEMAITVLDAYQRMGIGSLLLALLIRSALENGITLFRGCFNRDNRSILTLLRKYEPVIKKTYGIIWQFELALNSESIAWLP